MLLPFRGVTIYNRKQKEWWENMEEIIGLSKSKVELEEIWKRFHCALFVVLLGDLPESNQLSLFDL